MLEIGTGWGGFAIHAARHYGCHVTTTTISARAVRVRAPAGSRDAGLDHRITVLRRRLPRPRRGTFDKVVAIEMIEAVDWREYDDVLRSSAAASSPTTGLLALQAIVVPDESFDRTKHHTDFIKAAIFPGGCLPSVGALTMPPPHARPRPDPPRRHRPALRRDPAPLAGQPRPRTATELAGLGYDERFTRLWDFYFSYCEAGFEERAIGDVHLVYAAPGRAAALHDRGSAADAVARHGVTA